MTSPRDERKMAGAMAKSARTLKESRPQPGLFGAHMSVAGGLHNAFEAGVAVGCDCLQIFVKNQRQWAAPVLTPDIIDAFKEAQARTKLSPVIAHATYLINLASPESALRRKSINALTEEFRRCVALGVHGLVLHPGAHMGHGDDAGIERIIRSVDQVRKRVSPSGTRLLLETTAGQGTSIGHEVCHLARIIDGVHESDWLGVCLDTCHVFAAGHDLTSGEGYEQLMLEIEDLIGFERVNCVHVNDSKRECGSRIDRHDHIGNGKIGRAGFRRLVNDSRFNGVAMILETPQGVDGRGTDMDRVNLKRLRRLIESPGRPSQ